MTATAQDLFDFWLDEVGPAGWYARSDALDGQVRDRFGALWQAVRDGGVPAGWMDSPKGALAAIILTDQFPRNMFRDDPRAYATDAMSRDLARAALAAGHDCAIDGPARQFFYLPFMHSEDLADQEQGIALFAERLPGENLRHARLHRDVIARFGRFPWRNSDLGRDTTPEEQAFLDAGGYGALVRGDLALDGGDEIV